MVRAMQLLLGLKKHRESFSSGRAGCPAARWLVHVCGITPTWSPQEASLSVRPAFCQTPVTAQPLEPTWLDQSSFSCLCAASAAALSESVRKWFRWACVCRKGPPLQPPSLSGVPLNCRHFRREGLKGFKSITQQTTKEIYIIILL